MPTFAPVKCSVLIMLKNQGDQPASQIKYCKNDMSFKREAIPIFPFLAIKVRPRKRVNIYYFQASLRKKPQIRLIKFCWESSGRCRGFAWDNFTSPRPSARLVIAATAHHFQPAMAGAYHLRHHGHPTTSPPITASCGSQPPFQNSARDRETNTPSVSGKPSSAATRCRTAR